MGECNTYSEFCLSKNSIGTPQVGLNHPCKALEQFEGRKGAKRPSPATPRRHPGNTLATPWRLPGDILATPWRHPGDILAAPRRHPGDTLATYLRHPGDIIATIAAILASIGTTLANQATTFRGIGPPPDF